MPPKLQSFHGELPHLATVHATVLSAGPVGLAAEMSPGDTVAFQRLHFGWHAKLKPTNTDEYGGDDEYVGWIDSNQVLWFVEEEDRVRVAPSHGEAAAAAL
jgi:hypothetical protein